MFGTVEIKDSKLCPEDRRLLLSYYTNKKPFVNSFSETFELLDFKIGKCQSDADTKIDKVATHAVNERHLIHNIYHYSNLPDTYLRSMIQKKTNQQRECFRISDTLDNTEQSDLRIVWQSSYMVA